MFRGNVRATTYNTAYLVSLRFTQMLRTSDDAETLYEIFLKSIKNKMSTIEELKIEIDKIKKRNNRVELDKAWEVSLTRKLLILILTYFVVVIFFFTLNLPKPFINALVPTLGFFLSTLTIPWVKKIWVKQKK